MSMETLHSASRIDSLSSNSLVARASYVVEGEASTSTTPLIQNHNNNSNLIDLTRKTVNPVAIHQPFNLLRTISNESTNETAVNLSPNVSTNANDSKQTLATQQDKNTKRIGDFILFESNNQANANDTFNSAFNAKNNEFFYWKRFERKTYMKKLEAYFIMENSEHIYNFSEIILDESTSSADQLYAYVIYEPHYGDLHTYMKEKKRLNEPEAKHIFSQCVQAVSDCHRNGIIVRDIKLKKFVFLNPERTKIALANLEECYVLDDDATDDIIKSQQGCPAYVSPEVLNPRQTGYSGRLSDSWSLGIILYTLLLGRYPFHHQTIIAMFVKIARGKFQIPPSSGLSIDSKMLLRSLIRVKPDERLLPNEILAHNWLKNNDYEFKFRLQQAPVTLFSINQSKHLLDANDTSVETSLSKKVKLNNMLNRESNVEEDRLVPCLNHI
jgi:tribbles homolog 1/2